MTSKVAVSYLPFVLSMELVVDLPSESRILRKQAKRKTGLYYMWRNANHINPSTTLICLCHSTVTLFVACCYTPDKLHFIWSRLRDESSLCGITAATTTILLATCSVSHNSIIIPLVVNSKHQVPFLGYFPKSLPADFACVCSVSM